MANKIELIAENININLVSTTYWLLMNILLKATTCPESNEVERKYIHIINTNIARTDGSLDFSIDPPDNNPSKISSNPDPANIISIERAPKANKSDIKTYL